MKYDNVSSPNISLTLIAAWREDIKPTMVEEAWELPRGFVGRYYLSYHIENDRSYFRDKKELRTECQSNTVRSNFELWSTSPILRVT
jgi:hypothetical protein